MTNERRTHLLSLAVIALLGLTALSWFEGSHSAVAGYDFATSLNPLDELKRSVYLWDERLYAGAPNILGIGTMPYFLLQYLAEYATGSLYRGEMVFFALLFTLPGLTMYMFLRTMNRGGESGAVSFFGALFYMFNTFVVVKWNRGELITLFSYGSLPLFLTLVERGLKGPLTVRFLLFFICSMFFFPVTLGHSADFLIVTGIIGAFTLWRVAANFSPAVLKRAGLLLLTAALSSAWWAVPLLSALGGGGAGITSFTTNELDMVNYYSKWASLLNIMKLWFSPMYDTSVEFGTQFYRPGTLLFPLIGFSALLFRRDSTVLFFSGLALTGLWLSKGTSSPAPWVYEWMYRHIPYFFIFRAPSRYFPLIYTLSLAVLIGYSTGFASAGVKMIAKKTSLRLVPGAAVAALIFFSSWPLFSRTTIFRTVQGDLLYPSVFIDIPEYYGELNSWLKSREGYFRVHSFVTDSYLNYDWGYSSTDIMPKVIEVPQTLKFHQELVFGSNGFHDLMETAGRDFWNWEYGRTAKTLSLLSVGYITVVDDVMRRYLPDSNYYEILESDLENEPGLKVAARIGKAAVYENAYKLPHIFAVRKAQFVFGGTSSITTLSLTEHLDSPALIFIDRLDRPALSSPDGSVAGLIITGNSPQDIACENLSVKNGLSDDATGFYAADGAEYLIWAKPVKNASPVMGGYGVLVDGRPVTGTETPGLRWVNIGSVWASPGVHGLSITNGPFERVLAVPAKLWREEFVRTNGLLTDPVLKKEEIIRLKSGESYSFHSPDGLTLRTAPLRGGKRKRVSGIKEEYASDPDLMNWVVPGVSLVGSAKGITLKADKDILRAGKKLKQGGFDIERFPYVEVLGSSSPPGYFDLDLDIGVDTDGDGWADTVIKAAVLKNGKSVEPEKLSEALKKRFGYPGKPSYRALWASFELKKAEGVKEIKDASFLIKSLDFFHTVPSFTNRSGGTASVKVDGVSVNGRLSVKGGLHEVRAGTDTDGSLVRLSNKTFEEDGSVPVLEWKKIDPARYEVRVKGAAASFWLVFNESYNMGWKASAGRAAGGVMEASVVSLPTDKQGKKEITHHRMVNGYANGWWVTEGTGDFEIVLEFKPQSVLDSGVFISASALTVFLLCAPLYLLKGRNIRGFFRCRTKRPKRRCAGAPRE